MPKTITTIVTAVPPALSGVILYCFLYSTARLPIHDLKTASIASSSCLYGSAGNFLPVSSQRAMNDPTMSRRTFGVDRSLPARMLSNFLSSTPSTILPNIWIKRRYASHANRESLLCLARPSTVWSFSPRLRIVSIMPGIDKGAPDRTDTSRGLSESPNFLPVMPSRRLIDLRTSSIRPSGRRLPAS